MIAGIVTHTPLWVWPLLAFLLYRGWQASRDQETPLVKALAMPVVMLGLSLSGLLLSFSAHPANALPGAVAMLAAGFLSFHSRAAAAIGVDAARRRIAQRGSWQPLLLTLGIFTVKYSAAVMLALHPQLASMAWFTLPQAALYGAFSGIFAGRLLRIVHLYRRALAGHAQADPALG
ncbi:hypothetical protein FB599_1725 [Herbaspirillum sp. SJZ130]|nr:MULTISPECIES: DUF6622 family protein [unclassified Herbaspirillum]MBB5390140.1 hypothetical protein [Herbaspirillum sp. SJZ102]TQK09361.1 hypothetical protein FB599_1725 [Herbaspirillum sp. SJZ130]TQK13952.1 hypothetical protein FB598_1317 [Herbaspirillum sp. SJZ106]TWC69677.1 hypothetical protein FB597_102281 [Herbaspirillum sp. SJZ099]